MLQIYEKTFIFFAHAAYGMNVTFGESEVFLCFSSVISSWLWQQLQHYLLSAVKLVAEEWNQAKWSQNWSILATWGHFK